MIFESFRQSSRTKTGAGGTGLGLAICRGISRRMAAGYGHRTTKNGRGASVTFAIPAALKEGKHMITVQTMERPHEHAA